MRHRAVAAALVLVLPTSLQAQESLEKFVEKQVLEARYLSPPKGCTTSPVDVFKWPKAELQRCVYTVKDTFSDDTTAEKTGIVYLANPSPERVLKWLTTACKLASPKDLDACIRSGATEIRGASGAQFPVAGLVWEDQLCNDPKGVCKPKGGDGVNEGYIFRNGVTVRIEGYSNGSTAQITSSDVMKTLEGFATAQKVTGVKASGGYARIMSTTRESFRDRTGRKDIPVGKDTDKAAIAWSDIVGAAYRKALSEDDNPLITAAICENYGFPKACLPK